MMTNKAQKQRNLHINIFRISHKHRIYKISTSINYTKGNHCNPNTSPGLLPSLPDMLLVSGPLRVGDISASLRTRCSSSISFVFVPMAPVNAYNGYVKPVVYSLDWWGLDRIPLTVRNKQTFCLSNLLLCIRLYWIREKQFELQPYPWL